jgi:hypothetical protein
VHAIYATRKQNGTQRVHLTHPTPCNIDRERASLAPRNIKLIGMDDTRKDPEKRKAGQHSTINARPANTSRTHTVHLPLREQLRA